MSRAIGPFLHSLAHIAPRKSRLPLIPTTLCVTQDSCQPHRPHARTVGGKTTSSQPLGRTGRPTWPPGSWCSSSVHLTCHASWPQGQRSQGPGLGPATHPFPVFGHTHLWLCVYWRLLNRSTQTQWGPPFLLPHGRSLFYFRTCLSPRPGGPTPPGSEPPPPTLNWLHRCCCIHTAPSQSSLS